MKPTHFDLLLLLAQIRQESGFNPNAKSHAGAMGLMQIMPPTWNEWSKRLSFRDPDPWNPIQNVIAGLMELNRNIENFRKIELALTAYNWGGGNLRKLMNDAKSEDLEVLKNHKPTNPAVKQMPKEAREYAQRIFNHYADPMTLERLDDFAHILN